MAALFPPPPALRERAIVLVHGAWVGEWCWLPIQHHLILTGRPVHAVSLSGHGARRHEGGPHIDLNVHVDDAVGLIETLDLSDITLVGHSYGGRVITQVSQRLPERISALVFLDAHAPLAGDPPQPPERIETAQAHGGMLPFSGYDPDVNLLGSEEAVRWFMDRTTDFSFACFATPWLAELPEGARKTFVYATMNQPSRFEAVANVCRDLPDWNYHELDGPHWLMMSHPEQVANIIRNS